LRKAPSLRNNNGSLQVRVRLGGQDHFINRLGRWDDQIAVAKAQAISAEIWRDYREGTLDWSLCRYKPLVKGQDPELLKAMEDLMLRKRQGRTTHAYRVLKRYGGALRTEGEVREFLRWMEAEGLAASTRSTILSTIRTVQPANKALGAVQIKVPHREPLDGGTTAPHPRAMHPVNTPGSGSCGQVIAGVRQTGVQVLRHIQPPYQSENQVLIAAKRVQILPRRLPL